MRVTAKCHVILKLKWTHQFKFRYIPKSPFKLGKYEVWLLDHAEDYLSLTLNFWHCLIEFLRSSQTFYLVKHPGISNVFGRKTCEIFEIFWKILPICLFLIHGLSCLADEWSLEFWPLLKNSCPVSVIKGNENFIGCMTEPLWRLHIPLRHQSGQT